MTDSSDNTTVVDLADPLSPVTRKERRNLLVSASVSILMAWAGFVPHKIEGLGITFTAFQRSAILWSALFAVIYFSVSFIVYGVRDRMAWRLERDRALQGWAERHARVNATDPPGSRQTVLLTEVTLSPEHSGTPSDAAIRTRESRTPLERRLLEIEYAFRASTRRFRVFARRWTYVRDVVELVVPVLWGLTALLALFRALGYPRS
jgi:hypothetical protein